MLAAPPFPSLCIFLPQVAGSSVGRMLAKSFAGGRGAVLGKSTLHQVGGRGGSDGMLRRDATVLDAAHSPPSFAKGLQCGCAPGARAALPLPFQPPPPAQPSPAAPPAAPRPQVTSSLTAAPAAAEAQPAELQEAVQQVLAAGLPVLEKNGFEHLWAGPGGGASGGAGSAALAAQVARCCTGDSALGLGAFVKEAGSAGFSLLASPLGPLPAGRGLILVGDLNLAPRRQGRTPGRTTARFVAAAADDGRKLL